MNKTIITLLLLGTFASADQCSMYMNLGNKFSEDALVSLQSGDKEKAISSIKFARDSYIMTMGDQCTGIDKWKMSRTITKLKASLVSLGVDGDSR